MDENKQAKQIEVEEIASANDALVGDPVEAETSINAPIENLSRNIAEKLDNIGKAKFDIDIASLEIEKAKNKIAAANEAIAAEKIECRRELFSFLKYRAAEIYSSTCDRLEKKSQSAISKAISDYLTEKFKELSSEPTEIKLLAKLIIKSQIQEWGDREWDLLVEKTSKWESKIILSLFTKVTKKELFFDALKKFAGSIPNPKEIENYKQEFAPTKVPATADVGQEKYLKLVVKAGKSEGISEDTIKNEINVISASKSGENKIVSGQELVEKLAEKCVKNGEGEKLKRILAIEQKQSQIKSLSTKEKLDREVKRRERIAKRLSKVTAELKYEKNEAKKVNLVTQLALKKKGILTEEEIREAEAELATIMKSDREKSSRKLALVVSA